MERSSRVPVAYRTAARRSPRGVEGGQFVAELTEEAPVVFLAGMRINRLRKVRSWWPALTGMPRMLAELERRPEVGLLEARTYWSGRVFLSVQHWRSAEHLGRYARNPELAHHPAWAAFNKSTAGSADVGVFHETYMLEAGSIESLYGNMPPFGLGLAHRLTSRASTQRRTRTQDRLGQQDPRYVERL